MGRRERIQVLKGVIDSKKLKDNEKRPTTKGQKE